MQLTKPLCPPALPADVYLLDDPLSAVDAHVGRHLFDLCISGLLSKVLPGVHATTVCPHWLGGGGSLGEGAATPHVSRPPLPRHA